jgi:DNA-binding transcriptional regulator YiaG
MLQRLPAGTLVRVGRTGDAWLRRYSGLHARVVSDDGVITDVMLPGGDLVSLWRSEVESVSSAFHARVGQRLEQPARDSLLAGQDRVPGFSLQVERHRAGLTQMAVARAMGVSVPRISQIESRRAVRAATATRYLSALRAATANAA